MKRSTSLLSSALLGAGLLVSVGSAQAQTAVFSLGINGVSPVAAGQTLTLDIFLTINGGTGTRVVGYQPNIVFDTRYFAPVTTNADGDTVPPFTPLSPSAVAVNQFNGLQEPRNGATPLNTANSNLMGTIGATIVNTNPTTNSTFNNRRIGTYSLVTTASFSLLNQTQVGFTNFLFPTANNTVADTVIIKPGTTNVTIATGSGLTFGTGAVTIGTSVVPGPDSLAVFAMGGLAPALAAFRRRRAKKA